jgi:ferredoxin-like protein FixX
MYITSPLYKVIFMSKDSHRLEISEQACSESEAIRLAEEHISNLGWEYYQYKLLEVIRL